MQIFSTFESTTYIELALTSLEDIGIKQDQILAVPLQNRRNERKLFDSLHGSDGVSLIDKGAALGTGLSVVGACIGFNLEWGPIYWGLIGAAVGFIIGFLIDFYFYKVVEKNKRRSKGRHGEVVLIVDCPNEISEQVEKILWEHFAIGVAKIK